MPAQWKDVLKMPVYSTYDPYIKRLAGNIFPYPAFFLNFLTLYLFIAPLSTEKKKDFKLCTCFCSALRAVYFACNWARHISKSLFKISTSCVWHKKEGAVLRKKTQYEHVFLAVGIVSVILYHIYMYFFFISWSLTSKSIFPIKALLKGSF